MILQLLHGKHAGIEACTALRSTTIIVDGIYCCTAVCVLTVSELAARTAIVQQHTTPLSKSQSNPARPQHGQTKTQTPRRSVLVPTCGAAQARASCPVPGTESWPRFSPRLSAATAVPWRQLKKKHRSIQTLRPPPNARNARTRTNKEQLWSCLAPNNPKYSDGVSTLPGSLPLLLLLLCERRRGAQPQTQHYKTLLHLHDKRPKRKRILCGGICCGFSIGWLYEREQVTAKIQLKKNSTSKYIVICIGNIFLLEI